MYDYYREIMEYVNTLPVIDSHEHLARYEKDYRKSTDVISEYFFQYIKNDLRCAGMSQEQVDFILDESHPFMERWDVLEPCWKRTANTGYSRVLKTAAKDLYGIDRINRDTIEALNAAFLKTKESGDSRYHKILKEKCNIEYCIVDNNGLDVDRTYLRASYRTDPIVWETWHEFFDKMEKEAGMRIRSFDDWLEASERAIDNAVKQGAIAFKFFICGRNLLFEKADEKDAREYFDYVLAKRQQQKEIKKPTEELAKAYQDYMMHHVMRIFEQRGLVAQFHTGLLAGNGGIIYNENPELLSNLFWEYPNVKFDLLHMGYPYQNVMSALGKMFPNVYLNMSWTHAISPEASVQSLSECLDSVPVNKIIAFGGDYRIIDAVYGHLCLAKRDVSEVLARKVQKGIYELEEAKWMAKRMFYDNPKELYEGKGEI